MNPVDGAEELWVREVDGAYEPVVGVREFLVVKLEDLEAPKKQKEILDKWREVGFVI